MFRSSLRVVALLGALALFPHTADASVAWQDAARLSGAGASLNASDPDVALADDGTAVAVWVRSNGSLDRVEAAVRPNGGPWGAAEQLPLAEGTIGAPQVVADASGNATALWRQEITTPSTTQALMAATRPAGGPWSNPVTVGTGLGASGAVAVGVDAAGTVTALWSAFPEVYTATLPVDGTWTTPSAFAGASGQGATSVALAVAPSGAATAAWTSQEGGDSWAVGAQRSSAGTWSATTDLAGATATITDASAAIAPDGSGTVAWAQLAETAPGVDRFLVRAAAVSAAGTWSAAETVSGDASDQNLAPSVAISEAGTAVVAYAHTELGVGSDRVMTVEMAAGGAWSAPVALSAPGADADQPQVAADEDGGVGAVWREANGGDTVVGRFQHAGGSWSAPRTFSPEGDAAQLPQIAFGGRGAVIAWIGLTSPTRMTASFGSTGPAPASSPAASWLDAAPVSPASSPVRATGSVDEAPLTVMDADGNLTAIWCTDEDADSRVWVATRPAGGSWQAPQALSAVGYVSRPRLVRAVDGTLWALWIYEDPSVSDRGLVQTASRAPSGAWSAPTVISEDASDHYPNLPTLSVAPDGTVTAAWLMDTAGVSEDIVETASRATGGSWSASETLSDGSTPASPPQIAVDGSGTSVAAWQYQGTPGSMVVRRRATTTSSWSAEEELVVFNDGNGSSFGIQAGGDGRFTASAIISDGSTLRVATMTSEAGGENFSAPEYRSATGTSISSASLAAASDGSVLLAWSDAGTVTLATMATGEGWSEPVPISASGTGGSDAALMGDSSSRVTVAWIESGGGGANRVRAARVAGGTITRSALLSSNAGNAYSPQVALDGDGNGVVLWAQEESAGSQVFASGIDAAAPVLQGAGGVTVPASATAGQAAPMSASPFDVWSPISEVRWNFGDGTELTGTSVSHTYASAGEYTVTVTATDGTGRQRSTTRAISVAAAPPAVGVSPGVPPRVKLALSGSTVTVDVDVRRRSASRACPSPKYLAISIVERRKSGSKTISTRLTERSSLRKLTVTRGTTHCTYKGTLRLSKARTLLSGRTLVVQLREARLATHTLRVTAP